MQLSQGKLTITSTHDSAKQWIEIRLEDATSSVTFLEVRVELAPFAEALVGHAHQPCSFAVRHIEQVGKVRETKEERVPCTWQAHTSPEHHLAQQRAALAPFEVEGWRGNPDDLGNRHRGSAEHGYFVRFTRFVEAPERG